MMKILVLLAALTLVGNAVEKDLSQLMTLIQKRCIDCHDEDLSKGDIRFDIDISGNHELLEKAFLQVRSGDMPPPKKSKLTDKERPGMLKMLASAIHHNVPESKKRLTREEFLNSISDLLLLKNEPTWTAPLPKDSTSAEFNVIGNLGFSQTHLELYLNTVEMAVEKALETKRPELKTNISSKFIYEAHAKRPKINFKDPKTTIKGQPRTANGLAFPYFRDDYYCSETGYYDIEFSARSTKGATLLIYAGPYYQDGAVVNEEPRLLGVEEFGNKKVKLRAWLMKGEQIAFSTLPGKSIEIDNPVKIIGPITETWPPKRLKTLFPGVKAAVSGNSFKLIPANPQKDLERCIKEFALLAFRKGVSPDELRPYFSLGKSYLAGGEDFLTACKEVYKAILSSPNFLYHGHHSNKDFALASRMSFFFWRSIPDRKLLVAAKTGGLRSQLSQEVDRILESPKTARFVNDFTTQWLGLEDLGKIAVDYRLYPEFDGFLSETITDETRGFVKLLLKENLPLHNLIDSETLYINNRLAALYGIPGVKGPEYRKVTRPKSSVRGGILTQAAVMMATADGAATTPVKRGVWFTERILGKTVPLPPKMIAGVEADLTGKETIQEQLEKHRDNKACRSCHTRIDPYGVAFESFDPIGQHRSQYRKLNKRAKKVYKPGGVFQKGLKVDTDYEMADGRTYKNILEFKKLLMDDKAIVHRALTEKFYTFALGRELSPQEKLLADGFSKMRVNSGMKSLLKDIATSELFRGHK